MSADSTDPATAKYAERDYLQLFDGHGIGFWRRCDPWIAIAAIAVSLLTALAAVYWMPLLPA
jgi:hypothetical protein